MTGIAVRINLFPSTRVAHRTQPESYLVNASLDNGLRRAEALPSPWVYGVVIANGDEGTPVGELVERSGLRKDIWSSVFERGSLRSVAKCKG